MKKTHLHFSLYDKSSIAHGIHKHEKLINQAIEAAEIIKDVLKQYL